jgi:hypothetical protein
MSVTRDCMSVFRFRNLECIALTNVRACASTATFRRVHTLRYYICPLRGPSRLRGRRRRCPLLLRNDSVYSVGIILENRFLYNSS